MWPPSSPPQPENIPYKRDPRKGAKTLFQTASRQKEYTRRGENSFQSNGEGAIVLTPTHTYTKSFLFKPKKRNRDHEHLCCVCRACGDPGASPVALLRALPRDAPAQLRQPLDRALVAAAGQERAEGGEAVKNVPYNCRANFF